MQTNYAKLKEVQIKRLGNSINVIPVWSGVDRETSYSWSMPDREINLALRLKQAIEAGVVFSNIEILTDTHGETYVHADNECILGRYLDSTLRELGF